jgi:hypothetical protein
MTFSHPAPHWSGDSDGAHLADSWRPLAPLGAHLAACWRSQGPLPRGENWWVCQTPLNLGSIPPPGEGVDGLAILLPPSPPHREFWFLPLSPYLNDICPIFLLLLHPLDTALLFDVNAAIMGWTFSCSALKAASAAQPLYVLCGCAGQPVLCLSTTQSLQDAFHCAKAM